MQQNDSLADGYPQVFIMMGQSNMLGEGFIGTLADPHAGKKVSHGLQQQSLWIIPTAAVS